MIVYRPKVLPQPGFSCYFQTFNNYETLHGHAASIFFIRSAVLRKFIFLKLIYSGINGKFLLDLLKKIHGVSNVSTHEFVIRYKAYLLLSFKHRKNVMYLKKFKCILSISACCSSRCRQKRKINSIEEIACL